MARIVVIALPGDEQLYLADLDAGTVQPMAAPTSGPLAAANDLRSAGGTIVKGVNLVVAVSSSEQVASGVFDG